MMWKVTETDRYNTTFAPEYHDDAEILNEAIHKAKVNESELKIETIEDND